MSGSSESCPNSPQAFSYEASDRKIKIGHQRKYVLQNDIENNLYSLILYGLLWCEIPFAWTHGKSACPDLCAFSDLNIRSRKGHNHIDIPLLQGIHLGKPDNCPDFIYGIMKDCWIREPEKRVQFTTISRRLKDPYHDYDEPPSSDSEDGPKQTKTSRPGK